MFLIVWVYNYPPTRGSCVSQIRALVRISLRHRRHSAVPHTSSASHAIRNQITQEMNFHIRGSGSMSRKISIGRDFPHHNTRSVIFPYFCWHLVCVPKTFKLRLDRLEVCHHNSASLQLKVTPPCRDDFQEIGPPLSDIK